MFFKYSILKEVSSVLRNFLIASVPFLILTDSDESVSFEKVASALSIAREIEKKEREKNNQGKNPH